MTDAPHDDTPEVTLSTEIQSLIDSYCEDGAPFTYVIDTLLSLGVSEIAREIADDPDSALSLGPALRHMGVARQSIGDIFAKEYE